MNQDVHNLLEIPPAERDAAWEERFLAKLPHSKVKVVSAEPVEGPDHWPYLLIETVEPKEPSAHEKSGAPLSDNCAELDGLDGEDTDSLLNVIVWLSERGIGLVVNASKPSPDFVFTYGMVWNYREHGEFLTGPSAIASETAGKISATESGIGAAAQVPKAGRFEVKNGQQVFAGPPTEAYLPKYVRTVIKQFLMDQGVFVPKVLMVSLDQKQFDLCFSIESLKSPPAHEHAGLAEALAWFLPAHYSVSLLSEKTVSGFIAL